ncbi:hypothetical protein HF1_02270 [Mycoplasma haemofelis str. Langford 1]|uniref:Uncharacterized protein n=1 Tax=Mycoplasma haemofelis (strain Langford 1) TaxID=941640 RepID=E8ZKR9_MYCHL|nr:hypothetical protein [Mycoplasma haemofelis]CBY92235.1 hypothetical protein HF1_02270 [Mycoplasma haemofelis str. Langford 1]
MSNKSFLYLKNYLFFKRTAVLLTPLFLFTLASKELAFNSSQLNLLSISDFLDPEEGENSVKSLYTLLSAKNTSPDVKDYGSLIVKKLDNDKEYWIEQTNPFSSVSHGKDFKFKELSLTSHLSTESDGKYKLTSSAFEDDLQLKEVGNPNLLTVLDLSLDSGFPIQLTHVFPFSDLVSSNEKTYTVVNLKTKSDSSTTQHQHQLKLTKDTSNKSVSIEVVKGQSSGSDLASLAIKSFYVLFNDDPPQDPKKYFSEVSSEETTTSVYGSPFKKVFLDRWSSSSSSSSSSEPKYQFTTSSDFWKSTCQDPYKVGGFIDKDKKNTQSSDSVTNTQSQGTQPYIQKQLASFYEFREQVGSKPVPTKQYYYEQIKDEGSYVPSSDYDDESKTPCEKLDEGTKSKLKEYAGDSGDKTWEREPVTSINKSLIPSPLKKEIDSTSSTESYPQYKLVQSSFRAWGNAYKLKDQDIKKKGIYSSTFEESLQSSHDFSITINKDTLESKLVDHESLKKSKQDKSLQERPEISSMMEVYYPLSFSFYDPVSNYFKKRSLYLKTELDLSYLFYQDSFEKEVFSYDIGSENGEIGHDYGGLEVSNTSRKTPYGLSGKLQFIAGLSLSKDKDLKINLKAKVSGFVNTKNPCVDLRHRLYKISSSDKNPNFDCSKSESGWQYREYIHIPSFLTISLDREPEVSSFYLDKSFESTSDQNLKNFKSELSNREIKKVVKTDSSNDGEIYFERLGAGDHIIKDHASDSKHQITTSSFFSSNNNQYIYYYAPRKQTNSLDLDSEELNELKIHISGAKTTLNRFFHTSHFNTKRTVCTNDSDSGGSQECGNGNKYKEIERDKTSSELSDKEGSQTITVKWDSLSSASAESSAKEIKFRFVLNRGGDIEGDTFESNKEKYKKLFEDSAQNPSTSTEIPNHSCLAVWYSIKLWKQDNKLHYVTMLRPISLVSEPIQNSTAHKISGSAGSAGFEINKFEFSYKSTKSS